MSQAQLIHDRNTASHAALNDKADAAPERVHMTWTKEKFFTERNRNREHNANMAVRDLFNMKPWVPSSTYTHWHSNVWVNTSNAQVKVWLGCMSTQKPRGFWVFKWHSLHGVCVWRHDHSVSSCVTVTLSSCVCASVSSWIHIWKTDWHVFSFLYNRDGYITRMVTNESHKSICRSWFTN